MFFSHCPDVLDFLYGPKPCLLLLLALFLFFLLYETSVKPSSAIGCAVSPVVPAINFCWSCDMSFCLQSLLFMLALKLFGMVFALFRLSIVPVTNPVLIGDTLLLLFGFNCIFSVSGIPHFNSSGHPSYQLLFFVWTGFVENYFLHLCWVVPFLYQVLGLFLPCEHPALFYITLCFGPLIVVLVRIFWPFIIHFLRWLWCFFLYKLILLCFLKLFVDLACWLLFIAHSLFLCVPHYHKRNRALELPSILLQ